MSKTWKRLIEGKLTGLLVKSNPDTEVSVSSYRYFLVYCYSFCSLKVKTMLNKYLKTK